MRQTKNQCILTLAVDDDPNIREVIGFALEKAGFEVRFAADGASALQSMARSSYDLIVLDIGLPEYDGLEVCREICKTSDVPIVFLTARDDEIDRILGLEIGGDDYITKPFSPRELVARIKVILKRAHPTPTETSGPTEVTHGALHVDLARHSCRFGNAEVDLTASELSLLAHLMQRPEIVNSRQTVMDAVYGAHVHVSDRTIDSHIRNIRKKLAQAGCEGAIVTVHGVGFRMGPCQ